MRQLKQLSDLDNILSVGRILFSVFLLLKMDNLVSFNIFLSVLDNLFIRLNEKDGGGKGGEGAQCSFYHNFFPSPPPHQFIFFIEVLT